MALKAMADNNQNITCQEDARMYDYLAGQNADYIIRNVGDSLSVTSTTTSLLVTLGSGEAVVQGRHITNTDSTGVQLTLPQNTTAYLVLRYDLSQSAGNEVSFISTPSIEDDDLNNAGVVRDLVLYQYITDANGVATLTDKRNFNTALKTNINTINTKINTINGQISTINGQISTLNQKGLVKTVNATISAASTNINLGGNYSGDDYTVTWTWNPSASESQLKAMGKSMPGITSITSSQAVFTCKAGKPSTSYPIQIVIYKV